MAAPPGEDGSGHASPDSMKAWVLGDPGESVTDKLVPVPKRAEVLVRIDAVAICATDLEIIGTAACLDPGRHAVQQELHARAEYMGTVAALARVDEYRSASVTVEPPAAANASVAAKACIPPATITAQLWRRRQGPPRQWLHHRWRLLRISGQQHQYFGGDPDAMSDEEATLVVTAGTAMYGLTELGGWGGESGSSPVRVRSACSSPSLALRLPVILTGTRDNCLKIVV
jgi:L-iditol 2-dehydrogenase